MFTVTILRGTIKGTSIVKGVQVKLTDKTCQNAKPQKKQYKLFDGGGLFLLVKPSGAKHWRLKYYFLGTEKLLALGAYPLISLAKAREGRDVAKKLLAAQIDPVDNRRGHKRQAIRNAQNSFMAVALEWRNNQLDRWSTGHASGVLRKLERDVFPYIGGRPIADIDAPELLEVLRKIENRGSLEVATRVKEICGQVFRYGIATGKCKRDVAADLKGALKTKKTQHYAALDIKEMPEFLNALRINKPRLYEQTRRGIKMLMLTFVRTGELRYAKWSEFDFKNAQWEIPAERMKMKKPHIVPLSRQVIKILKEQQEEIGHLDVEWVFPNQVRPQKSMSENTILFALGRLGYKGRMTGHGFRALAMSAIKEKLGYRHEVIDRQLAHDPKSKIDRAYDRAKFLDERKKMMQEWADYLDQVALGKLNPKKARKRKVK